MKILLFFVLFLNISSTVILVTGLNDKVLLQPISSPGLVLRKVPRASPSAIQMPARQRWANIIFLKQLFELDCLKQIYGQGRLKTSPGSTWPKSLIPLQEGPAYKTVNKNQGNDYDKIPNSYRPNPSFENGRRYFGGNVPVIPMPIRYRYNINDYQGAKANASQVGSKFIKKSFSHSNNEDNIGGIEKVKHEKTSKEPQRGSVNKPIKFHPADISNEHLIPFNYLTMGGAGIPKKGNGNPPVMVGNAKTFPKFFRQSNRVKPTVGSYSKNIPSNNLGYGSEPRPIHSYEVEEIVEENIRFDMGDTSKTKRRKEENHMTKKPPGGRQFRFDEEFRITIPKVIKPAKDEVINNSINTILTNLINPMKGITETEEKTADKSNIVTPSSPVPKNENVSKPQETFTNLPPQANVESSLSQEGKNDYMTNKKDTYTPPHPPNNDYDFSRAPTTEKAQLEEKDQFYSHQTVSIQDFQNQEPYSTSTGKYDIPSFQPFFPEESQRNINFKSSEQETEQKSDDDFPTANPNDVELPEVFRGLPEEFLKSDRVFSTTKAEFLEENKVSSTLSSVPNDQPSNLLPTSSTNHSNQSTIPPKSTLQVSLSPNYLPEAYNNLDFESLRNLAERPEEKTVQQLFNSVPLSEVNDEDEKTETELPEKDEVTSTQPEVFEIRTGIDSFDADKSKLKPETEIDHSLSKQIKSSDDQHTTGESVEFENTFTTEFNTGNTITGGPEREELSTSSSSSSSSTWMAIPKGGVQSTTGRNNLEEDEKATDFEKVGGDSPTTVGLLDTSRKDSAQESNWKNSRKIHFNQEPTKVILDNQITDDKEIGQRRSDILINDTLEDYGENLHQISSLNYLDSLRENSSHLDSGSLIKIAFESIIPIIPQIINDLRDGRLSGENIKVLSHAFGKYWPYIEALSKITNLDLLPLIKMKDEQDLESILTSFVLEEPNTTTTVQQKDDENIFDYAQAYDYLEDYKEMYRDVVNQELDKEIKKEIRVKRDENDDLKRMEATREYFESIAEELKEEGSDYVYEDVMYDGMLPDENDSSVLELMEIADLQFYVRNVTS